jgi:hypothetical protein
MVETLRAMATCAGFLKAAAEDAKLLNARGPEGSTPFMYAVLYTGAPTLERLLQQGADVNQRNDANATALMWAASDLEKDPSASGPRRRRQRALQRHAHAADDRRPPARQCGRGPVPSGPRRESQPQRSSGRRIVASD